MTVAAARPRRYPAPMNEDLPADPYELFDRWMREAEASEPHDANAMALATADAAGRPSSRMVLLKGVDARGFVFYTNTESRKGGELAANPHASLNFYWKSLRRQVRIDGAVERVTDAEADAYFATRPRASQIGAWASAQSRRLETRTELEASFADYAARFDGREVPRPAHWSGFRVLAVRIEFWIDRRDRLHERYIYDRDGDGWARSMEYP